MNFPRRRYFLEYLSHSKVTVLLMIVFCQLQQVSTDAKEMSQAELEQLFARFPEADANGDGKLTLEEIEQFRNARKAKKQKSREQTAAPSPLTDATKDTLTEPTLANVAYGSHERQVLDLYRAASDKPTPVVIFFHGGGFRGGDKRSFAKDVRPYLEAGISVVSSNYRYSSQAIYPGPVLDGSRAVQFVRTKAKEWNIDPAQIALSGSSAGGLMALWIALHDDLADPASDDPVAQESTRVTCVVPYITACSIEPDYVRQHFGVTDFGAILPLFGVRTAEELSRPGKAALIHDASPLTHLSPDDPPILSIYRSPLSPTPLPPDAKFGQWIHHPKFGELLKQACDSLGVACTFYHGGDPAPEGAETAFVLKQSAAAKPVKE
jgi:acetyl esterase